MFGCKDCAQHLVGDDGLEDQAMEVGPTAEGWRRDQEIIAEFIDLMVTLLEKWPGGFCCSLIRFNSREAAKVAQ